MGKRVASLLVAVLSPLVAAAMPDVCPECSTQEPCGTVVSGTDGLFMYKPSAAFGDGRQFVTGWRYDLVRRRTMRVERGQFERMTHADYVQRGEDTRVDGVYWIASSLDGERVLAVASDGISIVAFDRENASGRLLRTGTLRFENELAMRAFMCELNFGPVVDEPFGHCGNRWGVKNVEGEAFIVYSSPRCSD